MIFTDDEKKQLLSDFNYGILLAILGLMSEFIYNNQKTKVAEKINQLIEEFGQSLNEKEQKEFRTQVSNHVVNKIKEFKEKIISNYGQEGFDEALKVLKQSPFLQER